MSRCVLSMVRAAANCKQDCVAVGSVCRSVFVCPSLCLSLGVSVCNCEQVAKYGSVVAKNCNLATATGTQLRHCGTSRAYRVAVGGLALGIVLGIVHGLGGTGAWCAAQIGRSRCKAGRRLGSVTLGLVTLAVCYRTRSRWLPFPLSRSRGRMCVRTPNVVEVRVVDIAGHEECVQAHLRHVGKVQTSCILLLRAWCAEQ